MRVGSTGTRNGMTLSQRQRLLDVLSALFMDDVPVHEFHHGDCIGADAEAHEVALIAGARLVVIHPPTDESRRAYCGAGDSRVHVLPPRPYIARNHDIVDAVEVMVATPAPGKPAPRSGTWATVRYAQQIDRALIVLREGGA